MTGELGIGIIGNVLLSYPLGWLADHWSRKAVLFLSAMRHFAQALRGAGRPPARHQPRQLVPGLLGENPPGRRVAKLAT